MDMFGQNRDADSSSGTPLRSMPSWPAPGSWMGPYAGAAGPTVTTVAGLPPDVRNAVHYQRTREMTMEELLLENRVVFLVGEINHASAARVMMQMLYLEDQKRGQDINLYINSPGGSVDDTLAIYDTMQFVTSDVATYCIGRAYSGGAVLLCAGAPGRRHILPHAKVMIHQPYGGVTGQTTDIQIQAEQIIKAKQTLNQIIAKHTGQPLERVTKDGERDKFFSAHEAKEYGLVDEVFSPENRKKEKKRQNAQRSKCSGRAAPGRWTF
jgi:ATP-dependent Clp protease, protease subunit